MSSNKKNIIRIIAAVGVIVMIAVVSLVACKQPAVQTGDAVVKEESKNEKPKKNITKTVAVFGVDKDGYRPDVIFLVHFDSETNRVKVVSVPRDTKVIWTEEQKDVVRKNDGYVVSKSKLNEMTSYGGIENIRDLTVKHMEDMLDIKIDNYVVVNIDAFKQIIDAIGGVEVDVPQRMYYQDNSQGLHIDLQPGLQVLDGDKAEQLIRFRKGYVEGDMGRIKTEQLFLEAFAKKVMSPAIIKDLPKLVPILFSAVQTDVGLGEVIGYYPYIKQFDVNNLSFHTIPGEATYEPGAWYFIPDELQLGNFSREVFFDLPPLPVDESAIKSQEAEPEEVQEVQTPSKHKNVTKKENKKEQPVQPEVSKKPVVPETTTENTAVEIPVVTPSEEIVVTPSEEQMIPPVPEDQGVETPVPDDSAVDQPVPDPPVVDENTTTPSFEAPQS